MEARPANLANFKSRRAARRSNTGTGHGTCARCVYPARRGPSVAVCILRWCTRQILYRGSLVRASECSVPVCHLSSHVYFTVHRPCGRLCGADTEASDDGAQSLCHELAAVFRVMMSGRYAVVTPQSLLGLVWTLNADMRGYKQQDAQELLYTLQQRWEDEVCGMVRCGDPLGGCPTSVLPQTQGPLGWFGCDWGTLVWL